MRVVVLSIALGFSAVTLTACGAAQGSKVMPAAPAAPAAHPDKKSELLYVSDIGTDDVYAYTYPQGTLSQTLTGFKEPFGECVDKKGDVFITDRGAAAIYEYAHGGSSPVATLQDSSEEPQGCSVDFKTGDLAVSNALSGNSGSKAGSVSIYKAAKGTPTIVTDSAIYDFGYCGYDTHSNLFVDGLNGNKVVVAELPSGKSQLTNLKVTGVKLLGAGGVRWAGKYLAVGDSGPTVYQFSISSGNATKEGSTTLNGGYNVGDFWINGHDIIGPDGGSGNVAVWKYPAGGSPIKTLSGFTDPVGATVSASK